MSLAGDEIRELVKQARSEVLTACQGVVEVFIQEIGKFSDELGKKRAFKTWDRGDWEAAGLRLLTDIQDALEKVQPAASDLEALLREARVKELWHLVNNAPGYSTEVMHFIDDRLAELEKARAMLGHQK